MITVIIPAYNATRTLPTTLSSLAAQTNKNFKVIIVDDCSQTDIKSCVDKFNDILSIKYIRSDINVGCGNARQIGLDNCDTDYLTFLDADDCMMPYAIDTFEGLIRDNHELGLFRTRFYSEIRDENNTMMGLRKITDMPSFVHGVVYKKADLDKYNIRFHPEISRWSEDCYFNMVAYELLSYKTFEIVTVLYTYQFDSATHTDVVKLNNKKVLLLKALYEAVLHVRKYKKYVQSFDGSMSILDRYAPYTSTEQLNLLKKLYFLQKENNRYK